jgi:hypothetical protein
MIAARGYADGTSARDGSDISLDERLAFERLLGDLSAAIPEDFPPEAKVEIEYCRRIGLRSNLGILLRVGGRVMGLIAFTAFHRTRAWPEDLIIRLNVFPVLVPTLHIALDATSTPRLAPASALAATPGPTLTPSQAPRRPSRRPSAPISFTPWSRPDGVSLVPAARRSGSPSSPRRWSRA